MSTRREDMVTRPARCGEPYRSKVHARDELRLRYHPRRSVSPPGPVERVGRDRVRGRNRDAVERSRGRRSHSMERSVYELRANYGRSDRVRSRSPPVVRVLSNLHVDERAWEMDDTVHSAAKLHRRYVDPDYVDYDAEDRIVRVGHAYDDDNQLPIIREEVGRRILLESSDRSKSIKNSIDVFDGGREETVILNRGYRYASDYPESSERYSSRDMDRFTDAGDMYQGVIHNEKRLMEEFYNTNGKSYAYHSRDVPDPLSPSQVKVYGSERMVRGDPGTTSSIAMIDDFPGNLPNFHPSVKQGNKTRYKELSEPLGTSTYDQHPLSSLGIDYDSGHFDTALHSRCDVCTSTRAGHNNHHSKFRIDGSGNTGFISHDEFYRKTPIYVQVDHEDRNLPRAVTSDPTLAFTDEIDGRHRHRKSGAIRDLEAIEREAIPDYEGMRRTLGTSIEAEKYLESGYSNAEFHRMGMSHEHGIPDSRSTAAYLEYPNLVPETQVERIKTSHAFLNAEVMEKYSGGQGRIISDHNAAYHRVSRREYGRDEEVSRTDARSLISGGWNDQGRKYRSDSRRAVLISRNSCGSHSKETSGRVNKGRFESKEMLSETGHSRSSYESKPENMWRHSLNSHKSEITYLRDHSMHSKPESSKRSPQPHTEKHKSNVHKHDKDQKRTGHEDRTTVHRDKPNQQEHKVGPLRHNPPEESKEFKHMAHLAFLDFSKRMNENPVARKLYKEEGKSGSLFCVVCKRSYSKEFLDTKSLVKHACMSRKNGFRALHLGLHKAICVLMGWNAVLPRDVTTWIPEILPEAEALAQKEDLIFWPPVVIVHNISLSNNNHKEWKLIDIEAIGAFLSANGFARGEFKISLGFPGDQSVMVVKFTGTFSGLHQAEKLHQYFAEKKHGRTHYEQARIEMGKSEDKNEEDGEGGKSDESLLYGYVGITEDFDKVDDDTRKRSSVKSKKEILDVESAPLNNVSSKS